MNKFTIKMDDKWMAITVKDWDKLRKERDKLKDDCGEMAMTVSNYEGLNETYLEDLNTLKDRLPKLLNLCEREIEGNPMQIKAILLTVIETLKTLIK